MMTNYLKRGGFVIRIFADSAFPEINDVVPRLPDEFGIEYKIVNGDPLPEILSYCDMIILKAPLATPLTAIRKILRPAAKIVLCATAGEEAYLSDEDFGLLDDLWIYPFSINRAILRLTNFVMEIMCRQEAELYKSLLDTLMDVVPDMVWFKNLEGKHLKVNRAFSHAAGKTRKMIEGKSHFEIWGGEETDCVSSELEVLNAAEQRTFEEVLIIDDSPHHLKTSKTPLRGPDGMVVGTLGVAQDLTNILNLNMEMGIFVEAMPFPLLLTCDSGRITHVNDKFLEMFHECRDDIIGSYYSAWSEWAFENASDDFIGDTLCFVHARQKLLLHIAETSLTDSFGERIGMVRAFLDVTAEKELELQVWKAANLDPLTSLANRYAFSEWVKNRKDSISHLLYLDLDNFKHVNDTFGHEAGDAALCSLAESIKEVFPEDFAARLGGDEFVICVCREMEVPALVALANVLQKKVTDLFANSDQLKNISLSIGVRAHCPADAPIDQLIREADGAMYKAKELGKARVELWRKQANEA